MKALSGRQPWWWAILHAGKRIENRRWNTNYRGPILLHAAAGCTQLEHADAAHWMLDVGLTDHVPLLSDMQRGGIVGRARIVDVILPAPAEFGPCHCARRPDVEGRWHMHDQYGFVLADVEPLPFVPCKGALGLWEYDPPPEIAALAFALPGEVRR